MSKWNLEEREGNPDEGIEAEEHESFPSAEEIEEEDRHEAALGALEKKKHLNVFQQYDQDRKKKNALELWAPPPEKGQGRPIRSTIDTNIGLFISHLLASKKWPWKNEGDFVRAAINSFITHMRLDKEEEYVEFFLMHWEMCRRAQLAYRLRDVASLVAQLEKAMKAHLELNQIDEAAVYLKGEMDELTVKGDAFSHMVLKRLEAMMVAGGPGMLAVWRRI